MTKCKHLDLIEEWTRISGGLALGNYIARITLNVQETYDNISFCFSTHDLYRLYITLGNVGKRTETDSNLKEH